jgi:hypothetical protein
MKNYTQTMKGFQSALLTRTFALGLFSLLVAHASGRSLPTPSNNANPGAGAAGMAKAAGCAPATQIRFLEYNNVRAIIENGGNKWQRRISPTNSGYEVPKTDDNSGPKAIFAGGLWMGGMSPDNQLKIAAVMFRQGGQNDFWPGPLTTGGDASVTPDVCAAYDKFWYTERVMAETHVKWKNCQEDPDCNMEEEFPNGYSIPQVFYDWPAMGNTNAGQALHLAPFVDWDGDLEYDPSQGDYPDYGFNTSVEECKSKNRETPVSLFGDANFFWIFNDKGNNHTETNGQPIGLEVHAQAFAFSSNNEINNMTFYNYVVINRGTQTLLNTYFGHYVDPDLGCADDDFAGCDVQRGLGFVYNWDDVDANCGSQIGYGGPNPPPPAIGIDFFEGPYQDYDGLDNPGPSAGLSCQEYVAQKGIPYDGLGIGYGDGVVDNERFGMRAYIYFNRESSNGNMTDPASAAHFYNYLRSIWKDNRPQTYGGNGYSTDPNAVRAYYMFPWDTDPLGWGTGCVPQPDWRELEQTPTQPDRRFCQSAGPFTLEPGAYNNVTVGVVYGRATQGGATASVDVMRVADNKAQALFDNCFKILDGPDAPDLTIKELDRELIVFITNPAGSNNEGERYEELDPVIPPVNTSGVENDRYYRFQGYKLYQLRDANVSVNDLDDINAARLIYQGDIKDNIAQIINYPMSDAMGIPVPTEMVNGANEGITHAIRITEDAFAQGDKRLVNFKTYHYMCIAYAYNNYEDYNMSTGTGQAFPYLVGRKAAFGSIRSYSGIPHKPAPSQGGTVLNSQFGDKLQVTRYEGQGNGANLLMLAKESEDAIMSGPPWRSDKLVYERGAGPVDVRIIDPLNVRAGDFEIWMLDSVTPATLNDAYWKLVHLQTGDEIYSDRTIDMEYEQLFPKWGFSVRLGQHYYAAGVGPLQTTSPIGTGIMRFDDPTKAWLTGIPDGEGVNPLNWIRSGTQTFTDDDDVYSDKVGYDDDQEYEGLLGGTWAPWTLAGAAPFQPVNSIQAFSNSQGSSNILASALNLTPSIQLVITKDKSKWSRSVVFENEHVASLNEGNSYKLGLRDAPSVDKEGRMSGTPGCNEEEATLGGTQPRGAGWFPGYAIDLETGERLNIAFSENSFWGGGIGRDMLWNPSSELFNQGSGQPVFGGAHWIYVFRNDRRVRGALTPPQNPDQCVPAYDECRYIYNNISPTAPTGGTSQISTARLFRGVAWVGSAMLVPGRELLETDVRIVLNVAKPYERYVDYPGSLSPIQPERNEGRPLYAFSTSGLTENNVHEVAVEALDMINVVPNPYYAFSGYETSRLDNRVKFINLPKTCTISIYNTSGTLVRKFRKDNDLTYLDWDLKNLHNIPIAGGVYICHIDVPGVGEKVLKWFGALRPVDMQNL